MIIEAFLRLKIPRWQHRAGSILAPGTIDFIEAASFKFERSRFCYLLAVCAAMAETLFDLWLPIEM